MDFNLEEEIIKNCEKFGIDRSELNDEATAMRLINCVEAELSMEETVYTLLEQMKLTQEKYPPLKSIRDCQNVSEESNALENFTSKSDVVGASKDNATSQVSSNALFTPTPSKVPRPSKSSNTPARLSLKGARKLLDQQYEKRSNSIRGNLKRSLVELAGIKKQLNKLENEDKQAAPEADTPQDANTHEQSREPSICQLCETDVATTFRILTVDDVKQCICHNCDFALFHKNSWHDNKLLMAQIIEKNNLEQENLRSDYVDMIRSPRKMKQFREEQENIMRLRSNVQQPIVQKATINSNNNLNGPNKKILNQTMKQSATAHIMQKSTPYKRKLKPKQVLPASKSLSQAGALLKQQQKNQPIDMPTGKHRKQHEIYIPVAINHAQNAPIIHPQPHINKNPNLSLLASQPQDSTQAVPLNTSLQQLQQQEQNELQVMQYFYAQQITQASTHGNSVMQMIRNMTVQSAPENLNATSLSLNKILPMSSSLQTNQLVNNTAASSSTVHPVPSSSSSMNQPEPSASGSIDPPPPAGTHYNLRSQFKPGYIHRQQQ